MRANRKQTLSILVRNAPGVLQRVSGLFSRRSYNIESITVGESEQQGLSRIIAVADGDERTIEQIGHQLRKLIDVIEVNHLNSAPFVSRELMLIKLKTDPALRAEIQNLIQTFRCSIIDIAPESMIVQVIGSTDKNDAFVQLVARYGIVQMTRTGETAMSRG
ncbi:acetolactate synthase small subunit [Cohnella faecalis]|uniref:acetolactate synthase small subunit n=1 Tax=Cohnella faecalis TaxID=2315694 RepID=UPI00361EF015